LVLLKTQGLLTTRSSISAKKSAAISRLLATSSSALMIGFAAACLLGLLPPQRLDPYLQWRFTGSLIDNGPVAVVGFGLLYLAASIDSENVSLQKSIVALGPWAAATALAFYY
jgi:hypothetical protein